MNQIKSMFLGYLSVHFVINEMTHELLLSDVYMTDSYVSAERKFIEFWERCLLTFPVHKMETQRYKILQFVLDLKDVDGDVHFFCNVDKIQPFDVDTLLLRRDYKLYNIKVYKDLCFVYSVDVPKNIDEIEKFLEIKEESENISN